MTDPVQDSQRSDEAIEDAFRGMLRARKERSEAEQRLRQERESSEHEAAQAFEESVAEINQAADRVKEIEASAGEIVGRLAPLRRRRWDTKEATPGEGIPEERLAAVLEDCETIAAQLTEAAKGYETAKKKEEQKLVGIGLLIAVAFATVIFGVLGVIRVWESLRDSPSEQPVATTAVVDGPGGSAESTTVLPPTVSPTPGTTKEARTTATRTPRGSPTVTATPVPPAPTVVSTAGMALIPAGDFFMGSPGSESSHCLGQFYIDIYEVTNGDYAACVQAGACDPPRKSSSESRDYYFSNPQYQQYPVVYVSWYDARTFCEWKGKRLPTEAEWEKAARGTDRRVYPWGSQFDGRRLNYCDANCRYRYRDGGFNDGYADTAPIGNYATGTSPYGVHDMAGNVSEWVADSQGSLRVVRGGCWHSLATYARTFARWTNSPSAVDNGVGFRCAR
jgi:formylglycine-generating enzyme required for sulfatase activity